MTETPDKGNPPAPDSRQGGVPSWVIFIAVVLAVSFSFKMCMDAASRAPGQMIKHTANAAREVANSVADAVQAVFQVEPQVRLESKVIQLQRSPILELAVIEQQFHLERNWSGKRIMFGLPVSGEKTIEISGSFTAKAGFDLEKAFTVEIDETSREAVISVPEAELLSVELHDDLQLIGKDGLLYKVKGEDQNKALNEFKRDAEAHALASDLLQEAQNKAEKRLREALTEQDWQVIIRFESRNEG